MNSLKLACRPTVGSTAKSAIRATALAGLAMAARLSLLPKGYAVLCYHRLTRDWLDCSLAPHIFVHVDRFREHLRTLRGRAEMLSLAELDARITEGRDPRVLAVCVTFDDGYADNLDLALPILRQEGVPATLFVSTGFVDNPLAVPWWDVNFAVARSLPDGMACVRDNGRSWRFDVRSPSGRRRLLRAMNAVTLRHCLDNGGRARAVAEEMFPGLARPRENSFCRWDDLRLRGRDELLTIGSHTVSHPTLSTCADWGASELAASKARIEAELGTPVRYFAFPFGGPAHIPADASDQFARQGFRLAVTVTPGLNNGAADRFALRRLLVHGSDSTGDVLNRIKAAMLRDRVRCLLPGFVERFEAGWRMKTCANREEEACARKQ